MEAEIGIYKEGEPEGGYDPKDLFSLFFVVVFLQSET